MNWLARLRAENTPTVHATNTTSPQSVAFVAPDVQKNLNPQLHRTAHSAPPALSPIQISIKATNATNTMNVASVASPPSENNKVAIQGDADQWCWPQSNAMNAREIETFLLRQQQFTSKGVSLAEAELLADQLVGRDRDQVGLTLCIECSHLQNNVGSWRCENAHAARIAQAAKSTGISSSLTKQLQRCPGFRGNLLHTETSL